MSPRPILKRASPFTPRNDHPPSFVPPHAVHFPPSPSLTRTFSAYSSSTYDRSPIVVAQNSCALPERGCPGRTYNLDDDISRSASSSFSPTKARRGHPNNGCDYHPRAWGRPSASLDGPEDDEDSQRTPKPANSYPLLPPLIPDLSSESDESDGFTSPPLELYNFRHDSRNSLNGLSIPSDKYPPYSSPNTFGNASISTPTALSFLPHPPSPPNQQYLPTQYPREDEQRVRRRRDRERRRERERERDDRIRSDAVDDGYEESIAAASRIRSTSYKSLSLCKALSSVSIADQDVGCLGGF